MAATAFLWSIAGLFIKVLDWNPFYIALFRSLIASLFIIAAVRRFHFSFTFPLLAAGIANALTMILFVTATKTTTAANAILLQYMAPIITSILGHFILREKAGPESVISLFAITAGIFIMFFDQLSFGSLVGNALAILSAFTFSFYFIFMRMQKSGSTIEPVLLSHIITVAVCTGMVFFIPAPRWTAVSLVSVLVLGIFQIGITSLLFAAAIKKITATTAIVIAVIEPVFNPIWVFVVLGERPGANAIIGGVVIVISATLAPILAARKKAWEWPRRLISRDAGRRMRQSAQAGFRARCAR